MEGVTLLSFASEANDRHVGMVVNLAGGLVAMRRAEGARNHQGRYLLDLFASEIGFPSIRNACSPLWG